MENRSRTAAFLLCSGLFFLVWMPFCFLLIHQLGIQSLPGGMKIENSLNGQMALFSVAKFTVLLSAAVSFLSCVIGAFCAVVFFLWAGGKRHVHAWLEIGLTVPFFTPPLFYAFSYLSFIFSFSHGFPDFFQEMIFTPLAVGSVLVAIFFPWVAKQTWALLQRTDSNEWNAAATLGATVFQRMFVLNTIRMLKLIVLLFLQVFVWSATCFSVVMMLGGGPRSQTLEVLIYRYARLGDWSLNEAGGAAILLAAVVMLPWSVLFALERNPKWKSLQAYRRNFLASSRKTEAGEGGEKIQHSGLEGVANFKSGFIFQRLLLIGATALVLWGNLPILFSMGFSLLKLPQFLIDQRETLSSWVPPLVISLLCSLGLALLSCGLAFVLSIIAIWVKGGWKTEFFVLSPVALSGFTLGLSWMVMVQRAPGLSAFNFFGVPGFDWGLLSVLLATQILPFFYWNFKSLYADRSIVQLEAASTLGANWKQRLRFLLFPRFWNSGISIFLAGIAFCIAEISLVSLFVGSGEWVPFALYLSRLYGRYQFDLAIHANAVLLFFFFIFAFFLRMMGPGGLWLKRGEFALPTLVYQKFEKLGNGRRE